MQSSLAQEILIKLQSARRVGIVFHRRPDPDSLGAGAAFAALLEHHQIPYRYYCPTELPETAPIFGIDIKEVSNTSDLQRTVLNDNKGLSFEGLVVCTFDAGDANMAGLEDLFVARPQGAGGLATKIARPFIINFDHHATNTRFGDINIVEVSCASTTELIYRFFLALHFPVSPRVAVALLAGILHDTDYFLNPATSASSLAIAGELLRRGISLSSLRAIFFERRGIGALQLIGQVLGRLQKNDRYEIAITYIREKDLERYGATQEDLDGIANILNVVGDAKVMCVIKEEAGVIKGSFRTTREDVDVGRLAEFFGGGGHRKASGFRIPGCLEASNRGVRVA